MKIFLCSLVFLLLLLVNTSVNCDALFSICWHFLTLNNQENNQKINESLLLAAALLGVATVDHLYPFCWQPWHWNQIFTIDIFHFVLPFTLDVLPDATLPIYLSLEPEIRNADSCILCGFSVVPKDSVGGDQTANRVISRRSALPPKLHPWIIKKIISKFISNENDC